MNDIAQQTIEPFDDYEIHPCIELHENGHTWVEQCEEHEAQMWSVFGHIPNGGVECIGDFKSRKLAEEIVARIHPPVRQAAAALLEALEAQAMADADPEASRRKGYFKRARELRIAALTTAWRPAY